MVVPLRAAADLRVVWDWRDLRLRRHLRRARARSSGRLRSRDAEIAEAIRKGGASEASYAPVVRSLCLGELVARRARRQ